MTELHWDRLKRRNFSRSNSYFMPVAAVPCPGCSGRSCLCRESVGGAGVTVFYPSASRLLSGQASLELGQVLPRFVAGFLVEFPCCAPGALCPGR